MLNAAVEFAHVYQSFMEIPMEDVDQNVFKILIAHAIRPAYAIGAWTLVWGHALQMQSAKSWIIYQCAAVQQAWQEAHSLNVYQWEVGFMNMIA